LSKNFQRQSYSAINYLSNGINTLAGDDPVHVNFGSKSTDPQQEGCAFYVSHAERCAVSDSRPSCICMSYNRPSTCSSLRQCPCMLAEKKLWSL